MSGDLTAVSDCLWEQFHGAVNMSVRELTDWLATRAHAEEDRPLADRAGVITGRRVQHILTTPREQLTADDARVMRSVVNQINSHRSPAAYGGSGRTRWRQMLMTMGHDPLRAGIPRPRLTATFTTAAAIPAAIPAAAGAGPVLQG
jgi:hypothetical protein